MKLIFALQASVILLLISGCSTSPTASLPQKSDTGITLKGVMVENAVITKSDGKYFYYRKKCESCGFVSPKTIGSGLPEKLFTCKSEFICPKCGKISKVSIKRNR